MYQLLCYTAVRVFSEKQVWRTMCKKSGGKEQDSRSAGCWFESRSCWDSVAISTVVIDVK